MATEPCALSELSDQDLLAGLTLAVAADRRVTAALLAHLAEVDRRRLYAREGCSSMFVYCTERLGLSADATQKRIQVARASRRFPQLLDCLTSGRVHLSGLNLLAPHLTANNVDELLERLGRNDHLVELTVSRGARQKDPTLPASFVARAIRYQRLAPLAPGSSQPLGPRRPAHESGRRPCSLR